MLIGRLLVLEVVLMMIKVLLEFFGWCIVIVILVEVLLWV